MKITHIRFGGLLSFKDEQLTEVSQYNLLIGPNNVGKKIVENDLDDAGDLLDQVKMVYDCITKWNEVPLAPAQGLATAGNSLAE